MNITLTLTPEEVATLKENLSLLSLSCAEGYNGRWDCSTEEGKKAFLAMQDDVRQVANILKIEIIEP